MDLMEFVNNNLSNIILCLVPFSLTLFAFIIVLFVKHTNLKKKYKKFMSGADGESLENQILLRFEEVDVLKQGEKRIATDIDAIREIGFVKSNGEGRRLIQNGGIYIEEESISDFNHIIRLEDFTDGKLLLRKGKKVYHQIRIK